METSTCPYCHSLTQAIAGNNFCSNSGDNINHVNSNAFYFNSSDLCSGEHISRLTLRSVSQGYQYHKVDNQEFMLDQDKYLVINEGQPYESELHTNNPIDGLVIAFNPEYLKQVQKALSSSIEDCIDDPFGGRDLMMFSQQCYVKSPEVKFLLDNLRRAIVGSYEDQFFYDELFHKLLSAMLSDYQLELSKVDLINVKNNSTKSEIHKRLQAAKEYIDVHHEKKLTLDSLAQVATLSSFHFLRLYNAYYGISPYQYIKSQRMKKAVFLLKDTDLPITSICHKVGYENHSSFSRLFKSMYHQTPKQFRASLSTTS